MTLLYPRGLRHAFLETGQVVSPEGIDEDFIPQALKDRVVGFYLFYDKEEARKAKKLTKPSIQVRPVQVVQTTTGER